MKILIHVGHWNIVNNCDPALRTGTGTVGEIDFNKSVGILLEKLLQEDGHTTYLDDANTNCHKAITSQNWDLALAIHADANIYGTGGGFVDVLRPDWDPARIESARIAQALRDRYFPETGIVNHPERSNLNTRQYYLWNYLTDMTPCVIIECGVLQDPHDKVILSDIPRVAKAIREGIRKAWPPVVVAPVPNADEYVSRLTQSLVSAENAIVAGEQVKDPKWKTKNAANKTKLLSLASRL